MEIEATKVEMKQEETAYMDAAKIKCVVVDDALGRDVGKRFFKDFGYDVDEPAPKIPILNDITSRSKFGLAEIQNILKMASKLGYDSLIIEAGKACPMRLTFSDYTDFKDMTVIVANRVE